MFIQKYDVDTMYKIAKQTAITMAVENGTTLSNSFLLFCEIMFFINEKQAVISIAKPLTKIIDHSIEDFEFRIPNKICHFDIKTKDIGIPETKNSKSTINILYVFEEINEMPALLKRLSS